jgi:hypothetical protein
MTSSVEKLTPRISELRAVSESSRQRDYRLGFNMMEPENAKKGSYGEYANGFDDGVAVNFGISIDPQEIPFDQESYDAFLAGLAGTDCEDQSIENNLQPNIFHELGLKLLLLHLGYSESQLRARVIFIRTYPEIVKRYREEAKKLRETSSDITIVM